MKKILFLMMLLPLLAGAQVQFVKDTTQVEGELESVPKTGAMRYDLLRIKPAFISQVNKATSDIAAVSQTINSINGIVTLQGQQIVDLQNQVAGVSGGGVVDVYDNTYTLKSSDNGATIFVHVTCTITCPDIAPGFKCTVIRYGSGQVSFTGAKFPSSTLNRINGQYRRAEIYYRTATDRTVTGDLTR